MEFPSHMAVENTFDAAKCVGRVFCGRCCCGQRHARYVRVDQGIPDGKELPKAMEVEKTFVVQRANLRAQTRVTERNISGFPREGSLALEVLVWTNGSRDSGVAEWLKAHTAQEDPCTAFWVEQSQFLTNH